MAENAVARRGASIALACRAFGVSETCYRYGPKLRPENEEIADLLTGLTDARKTWGFGLCFLHLRNVKVSIRRRPWTRLIDQTAFGLHGFGAHFLARRSKLCKRSLGSTCNSA
jgi:hypothetical protein